MKRRKPWIRNQRTAAWAAVIFLGIGVALTYDAWEGRGAKPPRLISVLFPN